VNLQRRQNLQRVMTQLAKIAIYYVLPRQKRQNRGTAQCQAFQRHSQALVMRRIVQSARQDVRRIMLTVGSDVHFREIQVQLGLPAIHAHCGVAKFFRFRPSLLCCGDRDTHVGNVEGIGWLVIERGPQVRQRSMRVTSPQERQTGPELLERFEMYHIWTLRLGAGSTLESAGINDAGSLGARPNNESGLHFEPEIKKIGTRCLWLNGLPRTVCSHPTKNLEDQPRVKKRKRKLLARTEKGQPFIPQVRSVAGLIPDDFGLK
jgi:hypothetical protein